MHEGKIARLTDIWVSEMAPLGSAVGPHPHYCCKGLAACDAVRGDGHCAKSAIRKVGEVLKGNEETSARFGLL
jgi:hypothetical protein